MFGRKEANMKILLIKEDMLENEWTPAERSRQKRVEVLSEDKAPGAEGFDNVYYARNMRWMGGPTHRRSSYVHRISVKRQNSRTCPKNGEDYVLGTGARSQ
jgi:hypothetical protein